jgi:hypothetical protein
MFTSNMLFLKRGGGNKIFLFLIKHCTMKVYGGGECGYGSKHFFLTLAIDGGQRSGSWPSHITPWVMALVSTGRLTSWAAEKA